MRRMAVTVGAMVAVLALFGGCATPLDQQEHRYRTFSDALQACRQQEPNRHGQKFRLPPTHPHIAACLKRHGWHTDGTRLDTGSGEQP